MNNAQKYERAIAKEHDHKPAPFNPLFKPYAAKCASEAGRIANAAIKGPCPSLRPARAKLYKETYEELMQKQENEVNR